MSSLVMCLLDNAGSCGCLKASACPHTANPPFVLSVQLSWMWILKKTHLLRAFLHMQRRVHRELLEIWSITVSINIARRWHSLMRLNFHQRAIPLGLVSDARSLETVCARCGAQEAMDWFKANPSVGEDGGAVEQYSVQDDNSDTSSVAATDSTAASGMKPRTGMGAPSDRMQMQACTACQRWRQANLGCRATYNQGMDHESSTSCAWLDASSERASAAL